MCATISTSPVAASVATQVTSPDASNLGWNSSPSSRSWSCFEVDTVGLAESIAFSSEVDAGSRSSQVYADCVDLSAVENASIKDASEVTGSVLAPGTGN